MPPTKTNNLVTAARVTIFRLKFFIRVSTITVVRWPQRVKATMSIPNANRVVHNFILCGAMFGPKENYVSRKNSGRKNLLIYDEIETPKISKGRTLNEVDLKEQRKVCVIDRKSTRLELQSPDHLVCRLL